MKPDQKYVAVKLPKDLHAFLKGKAKQEKMALGNYLFDSLCRAHNIKYVPASVEIPKEEIPIQKKIPVVSEEIQNDIDQIEAKEIARAQEAEEPVVEPVVEEPVVEEPVVEPVVEEPVVEPVVEEQETVQDINQI